MKKLHSRIQSDDLAIFGAFLELVKRRIEEFSDKSTVKTQKQESKNKLVFLPKIPINEVLSKVDDHITALDKVKLLQVSYCQSYSVGNNFINFFCKEKLESRSSQMRLIVRSMFIKLEDKRQMAMDGILMLYKVTQVQINDILKELDQANCELKQYLNSLLKLYSKL